MLEISIENYIHLLKTHDWWYFMSDDYSSYHRGKASSDRLIDMQVKLDPDCSIRNEYCNKDFSRVVPKQQATEVANKQ